MIAPPDFTTPRFLIFKADHVYRDLLQLHLRSLHPHATITAVGRIDEARAALSAADFKLVLMGIGALDGDGLDLLAQLHAERMPLRHVLVVTARREQRLLAALRTLPIGGLFDSGVEDLAHLAVAIDAILAGRRYWSQAIVEQMHPTSSALGALNRLLTPAEQLVLAIIGDGCDDQMAATRLGLKSSAVQSVRRGLHRKIDVQQRGDLVRMAVQLGYVRFTATGVIRPGFELLVRAGIGLFPVPANRRSFGILGFQ